MNMSVLWDVRVMRWKPTEDGGGGGLLCSLEMSVGFNSLHGIVSQEMYPNKLTMDTEAFVRVADVCWIHETSVWRWGRKHWVRNPSFSWRWLLKLLSSAYISAQAWKKLRRTLYPSARIEPHGQLNGTASYSCDLGFKSRLENRLSWSSSFRGFLQRFWQKGNTIPLIIPWLFPSLSLDFSIHEPCHHPKLYRLSYCKRS